MTTPSPRARWLLRVALAAAAVVLALAGAELLARAVLPPSYYLVAPERRPRDVAALRPIGPGLHHVRRALTEVADDADEVRILFLGDSFTYGSGLADEEQVFVRRIERALAARPPVPGRRYACFDAGVPGSMTYDWVTVFEDAWPLFRPHVVVPVFFLRNGQHGSRSIGEIQRMTAALEARHAASALFRHSRLVRFLVEAAEERRLGSEYLAEMERGYLGDPAETEEWKQAQLNLCRIRDAAEGAGAAFGVAVFPVLFGLTEDYVLGDTVDEILRAADAHGMRAVSLLPAFLGQRAESLWVSKIDQHPNERGHALAADALLPFVAELVAQAPAELRWPAVPSRPPPPPPPADPTLDGALLALARARGAERERLQAQLLARGADLAPAIAAGLRDAERTPAALGLLAALEPPAFAAALPGFLAAAERNGAVALSSSLPEKTLGADAAPHVRAALGDPEAVTGALVVLGRVDMFGNGLRSAWPRLGDAAPEIVARLMEAPATPDPAAERRARVATVALGRLGVPAAGALLPRLAAPSATERARAAVALGHLGPAAPTAVVAPLAARLADEAPAVRAAAAQALWQIAPVSASAADALARAAEDPEPDVRRFAALAHAELARP